MPGQVYCPLCGQKTSTRRLSFRQLGLDFLRVFLNLEKGLWRLVRGLTIRPGSTAEDYIKGKRKRYFNPFTFMAICIAGMLFIYSWLKPYSGPPVPDPAVLARISDPDLKQLYLDSVERIGLAQGFVNRYMNIISVLISPWFAFFLWLFFKRSQRNMAEITVAYILFSAYGNLVSTMLFSPVLSCILDTPGYYPLLCTMILLQTLYIARGMRRFLNLKTGSGFWQVLGVLALAGLAGFILVFITYFFYVYQDGAFTILQYL